MASTFLSRLSLHAGEPSIYETLRQEDESSGQSDVEERAGMALDEENLGSAFHDHELGDALADAVPSTSVASRADSANKRNRNLVENSRSRGRTRAPRNGALLDEANDDVPSSLLFEGTQDPDLETRNAERLGVPPPVQGQPSRESRAKWQAAQEHQRLYEDLGGRQPRERLSSRGGPLTATVDPKEQAMWRWANVENLDNFLKEVYDYYLGNGIVSIILSQVLNLL